MYNNKWLFYFVILGKLDVQNVITISEWLITLSGFLWIFILISRSWTNTIRQTISCRRATPVSFCSRCLAIRANEYSEKSSNMQFTFANPLVSIVLRGHSNYTWHFFGLFFTPTPICHLVTLTTTPFLPIPCVIWWHCRNPPPKSVKYVLF